MNFKDIALAAAQRGIAVWPTLPGERGPCKGSPAGWTTSATTDPRQITEWGAKWPNYNCICVCNPATSIALDIDDPELAEKHAFPFQECQNTLWVRTPGGGYHTNKGKPDFGACAFAWDEANGTLGWKDHAATCDGAEMNVEKVIEFMEREKGEKYPYPLFRDPELFEINETIIASVGEDIDEAPEVAGESAKTEADPASEVPTVQEVRKKIDEIMMLPSRPTKNSPECLPERLKYRAVDDTDASDLHVSHRMSSFFVFGQTVARQEGWEDRFLAAMNAMAARQEGASAEGCDIVDVILSLPASYNGTYKTVAEWAAILPQVVPDANVELRRNCARRGWIAYQFTANVAVLSSRTGMKIKQVTNAQKNKVNTYAFSFCAGKEKMMPDDVDTSAGPELPVAAPKVN